MPATTAPPLVVTVAAKELCRHAGLTCAACGQDAVIGVVYALTVDGTQVDVAHYRRCSRCHAATEEPFPCV